MTELTKQSSTSSRKSYTIATMFGRLQRRRLSQDGEQATRSFPIPISRGSLVIRKVSEAHTTLRKCGRASQITHCNRSLVSNMHSSSSTEKALSQSASGPAPLIEILYINGLGVDVDFGLFACPSDREA